MPPDTTIADALLQARRQLFLAEIETASLDARLLLQAASGLSHEDIIAHPHSKLSVAVMASFDLMIARRIAHEPVSRILGMREFFGRRFDISEGTLDPRVDTEVLVEEALALIPLRTPVRILDLGTGTGAIIISVLSERPAVSGVAVDLSPQAIRMTRENADRHGLGDRLSVVEGSWFDPAAGVFDLILSNPPYIPSGDIGALAVDVRDYDPVLALDGGPDGIEAYRRIADGASRHLAEGGRVVVEIGMGQDEAVAEIFAAKGFLTTNKKRDLAGILRVITFRQG